MVQKTFDDRWLAQYVGHFIEAVRTSNMPERVENGKYELMKKLIRKEELLDVETQYLVEAKNRSDAIKMAKVSTLKVDKLELFEGVPDGSFR